MRVYISGPITGTTDAEYRFQMAANSMKTLYGLDTEVINPYEVGEAASERAELTHEEYMKISLALMDICDAVYFLNGWENSKGCQQEHIYALNTGMEVLHE